MGDPEPRRASGPTVSSRTPNGSTPIARLTPSRASMSFALNSGPTRCASHPTPRPQRSIACRRRSRRATGSACGRCARRRWCTTSAADRSAPRAIARCSSERPADRQGGNATLAHAARDLGRPARARAVPLHRQPRRGALRDRGAVHHRGRRRGRDRRDRLARRPPRREFGDARASRPQCAGVVPTSAARARTRTHRSRPRALPRRADRRLRVRGSPPHRARADRGGGRATSSRSPRCSSNRPTRSSRSSTRSRGRHTASSRSAICSARSSTAASSRF